MTVNEEHAVSTQRIVPIPSLEWPAEVDEALAIMSGRPQPVAIDPSQRPQSSIIGVFAWHPTLMKAWMPFSHHLKTSTIPARIRELAIVRTTWLSRGEYEWSQHLRIGGSAGLSDEELQALSGQDAVATWSDAEAAALRAVEEICESHVLSDDTWTRLQRQLSIPQIMDLVFTVGTYVQHSLVFNTLGLQLEPGMTRFDGSTVEESRS